MSTLLLRLWSWIESWNTEQIKHLAVTIRTVGIAVLVAFAIKGLSDLVPSAFALAIFWFVLLEAFAIRMLGFIHDED